ncbi:hypothetical protein BaRGS_00018726 [Batillaria attramentaria]|uniref:DUF7789 domain-containing protein n=1 Tax=Batillaria attramentaria TaxID=370345 RepID=A0ABD0KSK1_9CAEN
MIQGPLVDERENEIMASPATDDPEGLESSTDYTKYGITDVPKFTVTTALGKSKTIAGLYAREWVFIVISAVNILTAIGLTIVRLVKVLEDYPQSPDFTFTILLLLNAGFCLFYVGHGVLRERVYELYAFMAATLVVVMYCILEYAVFNPSGHTTIKLARLIVACIMAPPNLVLAWIVAKNFGYLEFRIVGASEFLQGLYRQAAIFSCLLKFDLQATSSLVLLALKEGTSVSTLETVSLAVGLPFSLCWCLLGWITLRGEIKAGAYVFAILGLLKPVYYLYKVISVYVEIANDEQPSTTVTYSLLAATALGLLVWVVLMVELVIVYNNFGKGLKERTKDVLATETTGLLSNNRARWKP